MTFSEPLSQYEETLKDAIRTSMKESGAKIHKKSRIFYVFLRINQFILTYE